MKDIHDYTRVTDVFFPFSGLKDIDHQILQRAADRGTLVHNICDAIIADIGIPSIPKEAKGYIKSFELWATGKEFLPKPDRFFCDDLMLTGECDGLYKEGDKIILFDLKTPAAESKTWPLQGSAYCYLAEKEGIHIDRLEFVKLSKDGQEPIVFVYEYNFEMYLHCLHTYRYFFKHDHYWGAPGEKL